MKLQKNDLKQFQNDAYHELKFLSYDVNVMKQIF